MCWLLPVQNTRKYYKISDSFWVYLLGGWSRKVGLVFNFVSKPAGPTLEGTLFSTHWRVLSHWYQSSISVTFGNLRKEAVFFGETLKGFWDPTCFCWMDSFYYTFLLLHFYYNIYIYYIIILYGSLKREKWFYHTLNFWLFCMLFWVPLLSEDFPALVSEWTLRGWNVIWGHTGHKNRAIWMSFLVQTLGTTVYIYIYYIQYILVPKVWASCGCNWNTSHLAPKTTFRWCWWLKLDTTRHVWNPKKSMA